MPILLAAKGNHMEEIIDNDYIQGEIVGATVHDRALSAEEIAASYAAVIDE